MPRYRRISQILGNFSRGLANEIGWRGLQWLIVFADWTAFPATNPVAAQVRGI